MTTKFEELSEKYSAFDSYNKKLSANYLEFTLEELGMPSAEELLKSTMNIVDDLGGIQGWSKNNKISKNYRGFSICTNPDGDEHLQSPYGSLGHKELNWSYSSETNPKPPWQSEKNTYYDSYGFNQVHPVVAKHYNDLLSSVDLMPTRSRVVWAAPGFIQSWHLDEILLQVVRFNIPLITEPCHVLEINGEDEYGNALTMSTQLEVGKVYMWNTAIKHRVVDLGGAKNDRLSIVAGFVPWFEKSGNEWNPNKYFGVQPMDMITSKIIFPNAL
jgi:hypothetical protein|tara:strand:+ start:14244 stop:15059 length:816 start_codon:yes stop_codon:yes gene_type:complete